jgi:hypothetical protein
MKTLRGFLASLGIVFFGICILSSVNVYADSFNPGFQADTSMLFFDNSGVGSIENSTMKTLEVDSNRFTFMPRVSMIDTEDKSGSGATIFSPPSKAGNDLGTVVALADRSSHVLFFTDGRIPSANGVIAAPEPATLLLLGSGLFGVAARSWRRRR